MAVRDLGPDRYLEVLSVLNEGFGTVAAEFGLTAENTPSNPAFWTDGAVQNVVARGFDLFGVELDQRLMGCAFVGPTKHPQVWSLRHLAVRAERRHRGCGELLVRYAADRAQVGGAARLEVAIVGENLRLAAWYHGLGFTTVDSGNRYPGLVFTVDHLELQL
jgi:diamine N-acetyltransferase